MRLLAESSGRPLEADGNVGPREMAVTAAQVAGQNPAYGRPIRPLLRAALARVGPCARRAARGARRARSRLPARVRRVVTNRRPARPQPTVRDPSAARTRRVATSPRRAGGAVLRRHGPPVRRRARRARSRLPAQVRRAVTNRRPAGPQPTVRDHSAARPDALRPAHDGQEARCRAVTGLPSGGARGHDSPPRSAEWSPTVGWRGRSRRFVTSRRHAPDALRPAHDGQEARCQPAPRLLSVVARDYSPDSAVRTRIASLSGHSTTSSGAARRMVCRSELLSATPEAVDTPPCSSEAPKP